VSDRDAREPREPREPRERDELRPEHVRAVRLGHGANCSSVGSVIDTLFLASAAGGAIFAAICAAMKEEPVQVVGGDEEPENAEEDPS
jgi:hypothetical protein